MNEQVLAFQWQKPSKNSVRNLRTRGNLSSVIAKPTNCNVRKSKQRTCRIGELQQGCWLI